MGKISDAFWKKTAEEYDVDFNRVLVWDAFSNMFLDTSFNPTQLDGFAKILAESPFSDEELAHILRFEIGPVCWSNQLWLLGGEGIDFDEKVFIPRCRRNQKIHKFKSSGNPNRIPFSLHLWSPFALEAYFLLYQAIHLRHARAKP